MKFYVKCNDDDESIPELPFDDDEINEENSEYLVQGADERPATPPRFAPVFTGVLDQKGNPIIKHPVVAKMGFWPEEKRYHTPTEDMHTDQSVVGWYYQST